MNDQKPKNQFWNNCGIFISGILVGAILALSSELALKKIELSKNQVEIQVTPTKPTKSNAIATNTTATELTIPPPPTGGYQPPTTAPSPTIQPAIASLKNVPKLPSSESPKPSVSPNLIGTEEVKFELGTTGTTISNSLQANQSKRYNLKCSGGQEMTVKIEEGIVSADIIDPNGAKIGAAVGALQWQGKLSSSGNYTIEVSTPKQSNYAVKVEVN
ncbi:hypothetical protein BCD67_01000 [Oscillatoriales cyanobacterium USR001]|nr:hypothetical protein BCD67_01000 [Oscillatoriales cyanobacterium USR001]